MDLTSLSPQDPLSLSSPPFAPTLATPPPTTGGIYGRASPIGRLLLGVKVFSPPSLGRPHLLIRASSTPDAPFRVHDDARRAPLSSRRRRRRSQSLS